MGNPFTPSTIGAAYNLNPPSDNGANTANNEIAWDKHIDKIGDPLVSFTESTDANVNAAFMRIIGGGDTISKTVNYEVQNIDQGRAVLATVAGITITTPDAGIVDEPFYFVVLNVASDTIFLDGNGAQTINGDTLPISVGPGEGTLVWTDANNWFVLSEDLVLTLGAGIVETLVDRTFIPADRGKLIRVTAPDKVLSLDDAALFSDKTVFQFNNQSTGNATLAVFTGQTYNGDSGPFTVPPRKGGQIWTDGANWFGPGFNFQQQFLRGHLFGLGTKNSTTGDSEHDITFADGEARDNLNLYDFRLPAALTKQIDFAFALGNNVGGRAANLTLEPETWYHMHLVLTDSGADDIGFDTSFIANNLINNTPGIVSGAAGRHRRIGSVLTDDNANIHSYIQEDDRWRWNRLRDHVWFNETAQTTAKLRDAHVPPGLKILGEFTMGTSAASQAARAVRLSDPDSEDLSASFSASTFNVSIGQQDTDDTASASVFSLSDAAGQIRIRSNGNTSTRVATEGWLDTRGRFS